MKNLLKKYTSATEHPEHFEVKAKDGKSFKIGKAMLNPELRGKLQKFTEMTKAQHFDEGGQALPPVPDAMQTSGQIQAPSPDASSQPFQMSGLPSSVVPTSGLPDSSDSQSIPDNSSPSDQSQIPADGSAAASPQASASPQVTTPAEPVHQPQVTNSGIVPVGEFNKGLALEQQGIDQDVAARTSLGEDTAKAYAAQMKSIAAANKQYDSTIQTLNNQSQALYNQLSDPKSQVNPNHYWQNKSTGGTIMAAISIALGGLGGGLQKNGSNVALDVIEKQIQRDVDAQAMNLQNKQSLLAKNLALTQNMQQAKMLTYSQLSTVAAAQVARAAAMNMGPQAQALGSQLTGKLMQNAGQMHQQFAITSMAMNPGGDSGANGGESQLSGSIRVLNALKDPRGAELQKKFVPGGGPNGEDVLAKLDLTPENRDQLVAMQNLNSAIKDLRDFSAKHSGTIADSPENAAIVNEGAAKAGLVQNALRAASHAGVYKESENAFMTKIASDNPTAFFSKFRTDPGYKAVEMDNQMKLKNLRTQLGIPQFSYQGIAGPKSNNFSFVPQKPQQ